MLKRPWAAPWRKIAGPFPKHVQAVPTMITPDERRMLVWTGWKWWRGKGAVVDLGSYIGGSTARLAHGMELNGAPGKVIAFDRFTSDEGLKHRLLYPAGVPRFEGDDMFPAAQALLAPFGDRVEMRRGDVSRMEWDDGPIEVMHVDLAKSPMMTAHILRAFAHALIPESGLMIQQDYLHPRNPWIPVAMEFLSDCYEPIAGCRRNSVLFRVMRAPTAAEVDAALVAMTDREETLRLLTAAQHRLPNAPHRAALSHAILMVKASADITPGTHASHLTDPGPEEAELYEMDPLAET